MAKLQRYLAAKIGGSIEGQGLGVDSEQQNAFQGRCIGARFVAIKRKIWPHLGFCVARYRRNNPNAKLN